MASLEMQWAIDKIAADRAVAGVVAHRYDPHAARAANPWSDCPVPDGIVERLIVIGGLPCVWATPHRHDPQRRIVYFHGGGYCAGSYGSHRALAAWLAEFAQTPVLFPEYRLAPEHKFPTQIDDGWSAYRHALAFGPDDAASEPERIMVAGDSAGGGLAIAVALRARDEGTRAPDAIASLCGMLDFDETTSAFLQMNQRTRDMARSVVAWLADLRHPWLSPVHADLRALPSILLQTGTADYCRGDSERFAANARAAGGLARLDVVPDAFHVWQRFAPKLPEATEALKNVADFLLRPSDSLRSPAISS